MYQFGGTVYTDVQALDARFLQEGNHGVGASWDIGHFRCNMCYAKSVNPMSKCKHPL